MAKGKTVERGYGEDHRRRRRRWKIQVDQGLVLCWRCGKLIRPDEPWDLGHSDVDRSLWTGPEHTRCNRATNSRARRRRGRSPGPRPWPPRPREDDWDALAAKVPGGHVRCGSCGWLIEQGQAWYMGPNGPEHKEDCPREYPPGEPPRPRTWSRNW
jgi:hypothetical protein